MNDTSSDAAERPLHENGTADKRAEAAADAIAAMTTDGRSETARARSGLMHELFEALDDIAGVVVALEADPEHARKAQTLDQAGKRIIDTLVREFSFKSAQVEILLRELDDVDEAWGTYAQKVARRNERLGGAVA